MSILNKYRTLNYNFEIVFDKKLKYQLILI